MSSYAAVSYQPRTIKAWAADVLGRCKEDMQLSTPLVHAASLVSCDYDN